MKPHLRKACIRQFAWTCQAGTLLAYGRTPREAYDRLMAYCAELNRDGMGAYRASHEDMN